MSEQPPDDPDPSRPPATADLGRDDGRDDAGGDGPARPVDSDRARRRTALRILTIGAPAALVLSLLALPLGFPGEVGGLVFLTLLSLVFGVAGAVLAVGMVLDQLRGDPVSLRRVALSGVLLLATLALLIASAGAAVDVTTSP